MILTLLFWLKYERHSGNLPIKTCILSVLHYLWTETLFLNYSPISFSDLRKRFEREPLMTRVQVSKTTQLDCLPPEGKPLPEVSC